MNQICAKVYFLISTGEILMTTSEMKGSVIKTTKEQDISTYFQLSGKTSDEVDYIELEYGTLSSKFTNIKSYSVNLETKTLDCIYYTQEELDAQAQTIANEEAISNRINIISDYASLDNNSIDVLENAIIEYETNLITGGVS